MTEPTEFNAGDSVSWTRTLSDYPAPTWTLSYYLTHLTLTKLGPIVASASGTDHQVDIAAATSAGYAAGDYTLIGRVTNGVDVATVINQPIRVLPNPVTDPNYDGRTYAKRTLDSIEAVIGNRATLDQESYTINGRSLSRTKMTDLIALRDHFRAEVELEEDQARIAAGEKSQRHIHSRF